MNKKEDLQSQQQHAINALRRNQRRLLDHKGVTSVGVGFCSKGGKETNEVCIVCTVGEKLSPEELEAQHVPLLPEAVPAEDGSMVKIDVVQRSFKPSFQLQVPDPPPAFEAHDVRRSKQNPMMPGISVSHIDGTAGSIGAFVYDRETGEPLLLSNWHVLNGPSGQIGDTIVQPGPYDDPSIQGNVCGSLLRSHLGMAGDCAVARIDQRAFNRSILELNRTPKRMADPDLRDLVVKSGRTTGVTYGIVSRLDVVAKINYGGNVGEKEIGGFEIRPNPAKPSSNGEVSMGGDSGSLWVPDVPANDPNADVVLGLHFAGETDPEPSAEHAIACKITSVAEKLKIVFEPNSDEIIDEQELLEEIFTRLSRLETALSSSTNKPCSCQSHGMDETSPTSNALVTAEAGIPIHGNWCGPGHGRGRTVDDLDAACKTHDECYDHRGYFDCDCDRDLVRAVDRLIASRRISGRARTAAVAVRAYFGASPCVRHARVGGRVIPIPSLPPVRVPNIGGDVGRAVRNIGRRFGF